MEHPKYELPDDPHAQMRYESAKRHVEFAKKAGKSSEEIHALFKSIMEFDPMDIDKIPNDEAHAKYKSAMVHVKAMKERGASADEIHDVYKKIMSGIAVKHH